jgi:hypothetical protein
MTGHCTTWTLDHGLDHGLDCGLEHELISAFGTQWVQDQCYGYARVSLPMQGSIYPCEGQSIHARVSLPMQGSVYSCLPIRGLV